MISIHPSDSFTDWTKQPSIDPICVDVEVKCRIKRRFHVCEQTADSEADSLS